MTLLAWRILMRFIDHAKQRNKNECWYYDYPGYIASWTLGEMLGGSASTIDPVRVKIHPENNLEMAVKELIDAGLIEEMEDLHCRYRLIVKAPQPAEPTIAEYWTYPPQVQGKIREKVDLDEQLSDL